MGVVLKSNLRETVRKMIVEELARLEGGVRPSATSVDDQIDAHFNLFEKRSLPDSDITSSDESPEIRGESARFSLMMILEAEDQEEEVPEAPVGEETQGDAPEVAPDKSEPSVKQIKPKLKVESFTRRVARLIESHINLLDVPTVIINRAASFITENYDEETSKTFIEMLEKDHGLAVQPKDNEPERPIAVGAGPG